MVAEQPGTQATNSTTSNHPVMPERGSAPKEREDVVLSVRPAPAALQSHGITYPQPRRRAPGPRWSGYTAFVLSGGGARGALEVGALRALLEAGEYPDVIIGTSIGSWNGAVLAQDPSLANIERLAEVWRGITASQIMLGRDLPANYPSQALAGIMLLNAARRIMRGQTSLYGNEGIRKLLTRQLGGLRFEDLRVPFRVVATNLTTGSRAVLSTGKLVPALMASSSIPGIFPPVCIDNALYADGGMLDHCSLEAAVEMGARRLFLLAIGHDVESDGGVTWQFEHEDTVPAQRVSAAQLKMAAVLERSAQVLGRYQLERALERLPRGIETHVICLSTGNGGGMLDFHDLPGWIEQGYETTRTYLRGLHASPSGDERRDERRDEREDSVVRPAVPAPVAATSDALPQGVTMFPTRDGRDRLARRDAPSVADSVVDSVADSESA